jgi:FkbM family methyltransferase
VFALLAERHGAKAIAVEANPETFKRLRKSLALNSSTVEAVNAGLGDRHETLLLYPQRTGNAGGSSFVQGNGDAIPSVCLPLEAVARNCDVLKLDVEGMEHRVLAAYLPLHRPRAIILEAFGQTDALALCQRAGYRLVDRTAENCLLVLAGVRADSQRSGAGLQ